MRRFRVHTKSRYFCTDKPLTPRPCRFRCQLPLPAFPPASTSTCSTTSIALPSSHHHEVHPHPLHSRRHRPRCTTAPGLLRRLRYISPPSPSPFHPISTSPPTFMQSPSPSAYISLKAPTTTSPSQPSKIRLPRPGATATMVITELHPCRRLKIRRRRLEGTAAMVCELAPWSNLFQSFYWRD
jgi:hypothetical protein